jgi:hypothetical protein
MIRNKGFEVFGKMVPDRAKPCPHCGQPMIPPGLSLPPIKQRILNVVRRRPGIDAESLRGAVWGDDPNGGPECRHGIYVHVHQLNQRLAPLGIVIRAPKGAGAGYRILPRVTR